MYLCFFVDIFTSSFDDFISMKFLIAVFLPVSPFIPTSPFINFRDFCQPPRLLHPPHLLFWLKFASLPVHSTLPFNLKLESTAKISWFRPPSGGKIWKINNRGWKYGAEAGLLKRGRWHFPYLIFLRFIIFTFRNYFPLCKLVIHFFLPP